MSKTNNDVYDIASMENLRIMKMHQDSEIDKNESKHDWNLSHDSGNDWNKNKD